MSDCFGLFLKTINFSSLYALAGNKKVTKVMKKD